MKTVFFNPFEKYTEKTLLIAGLLFSGIGTSLAFLFNARFDGVIDLHFTKGVSFYEVIIDLFNTIFCTFLILFITGRYINKKTRVIDILCTVMIARIPFYLLTLFNSNNMIYKSTESMLNLAKPEDMAHINIGDMAVILVFAIITIAFLVWFFILLWNGFKVATNAKGTKHVLLFSAAIVIAEILSKTFLYIY